MSSRSLLETSRAPTAPIRAPFAVQGASRSAFGSLAASFLNCRSRCFLVECLFYSEGSGIFGMADHKSIH